MIKRIQFVGGTARAGDGSSAPWHDRLASPVDAPSEARPNRVAVCTAIVDDRDDPPVHPGIGLTWFDDPAHLERFENWSASAGGGDLSGATGPANEDRGDLVVVAEEHVMRGADWLVERWRDGDVKFKHMALARRAAGLTPAQFAERWSVGAGRVVGSDGRAAVVIPDEVRGRAYVQNRPRSRVDEWPYDAVNEVWFDELEQVRTRVDWFHDNVGRDAERDLISQNWFLVVREDVLLTR